MGWSHTADAGKVMQKFEDICRSMTGSSNAYELGGKRYFVEWERADQADGGIAGKVMEDKGDEACDVCDVYIDGSGYVVKGRGWLPVPRLVVARAIFPGGKPVLTGHTAAGEFVVGVPVKTKAPIRWMRQGVGKADRERIQKAAVGTFYPQRD